MRLSDGRPGQEQTRANGKVFMTHLDAPSAGAADDGPALQVDDLDLTPQALANAPASQEDPDSIVYIGITD
jgi:hypothetical protein